MDNLCHSLVGAAFAGAGLSRKSRFATAALIISANLPDVDVLVYTTSMAPVAFRRGWTHGVVAQLLLPVALTAVLFGLDRMRPVRRRGGGSAASEDAPEAPPLRVWWLLLLAFLGVYSHVFLDYLNNYGVRLLAPTDWRWFYGDSVFIVDPWLWLSLGAGVWLSRKTHSTRPARGAVVFASLYVVLMLMSARAARETVTTAWRDARGVEPRALMVGPMPVTPLTRAVIVDAGDRYETGTFSWRTASVTFDREAVAKNSGDPAVLEARRSPAIRAFLSWSRFPYWIVSATPDGTMVTVRDMRFSDRLGFQASALVPRTSAKR